MIIDGKTVAEHLESKVDVSKERQYLEAIRKKRSKQLDPDVEFDLDKTCLKTIRNYDEQQAPKANVVSILLKKVVTLFKRVRLR